MVIVENVVLGEFFKSLWPNVLQTCTVLHNLDNLALPNLSSSSGLK